MPEPAYIDAVVHYRMKFPSLSSLGQDAAIWNEELATVSPEAFDALTGTNVTLEGGSVSGVLNFRQVHKVRALHARRAELDSSYVNPYTIPVANAFPGSRLGFLVQL